MIYAYIAGIIVCEALAFYLLKRHALTGGIAPFLVAIALYAVICFLLVKTFAFKDIGIVNVLWSVFSIAAIILVGALAFHESISWKEAAGIGFAVVGVVLLGGR